LARERSTGPARQIVGLEIGWDEVEALFARVGLPPQVPATASRVHVPLYDDRRQVGRATSTTWSPVLKRLIGLGTVDAPHFAIGSALEIEITVEGIRQRAPAHVVATPFFNPPRKTALPPA
jgi:aminomethyltransferase